MPKCPMSEMALHSLKMLADSYDVLIDATQKLEKSETPTDGQKRRAWRRVEHVGRVIDNLLANWEQSACPAVFHDCSWEKCQHDLAIISCLTPFNQWECPQLIRLWQQQNQTAPPETKEDN